MEAYSNVVTAVQQTEVCHSVSRSMTNFVKLQLPDGCAWVTCKLLLFVYATATLTTLSCEYFDIQMLTTSLKKKEC